MTQRLIERLQGRRAAGRKLLVPFLVAGDPGLAEGVAAMHALVAAGADLIELGMPFSDPMADGPVIQRASERAIARGTGLAEVLALVAAFRREDATTPVVLMGYLNPIVFHGEGRFLAEAAAAGVDALLLVDCPLEESATLAPTLTAQGLSQILLVAPTTSEERLSRIAAAAQGFLYFVSLRGITGASHADPAEVSAGVARIRAHTALPVLVGFGVRDADSARALSCTADGVVVGSALVERLAVCTDPEAAASTARSFLTPLRAALDTP